MDNQEQKHERRVRYKGTHPKSFKEKYKELQPEKYAEDVAKIIQKGNTPAGSHRSIMVNEILNFLNIQPGQKGIDATLGYGGHTSEMLKCLSGQGHLYSLDVDPIELPRTQARLLAMGFDSDVLTIKQMNFSEIDSLLNESGQVNFVLADLGVSSMQIDNPDRGFTFKSDGPLDLRLNPTKGQSAAQRLKEISLDELEGMLMENADEPHATRIAEAIISAIDKGQPLETTTQLRDLIKNTLHFVHPKDRDEVIKKTCQRCFQALRIDVNNEFEVLFDFLEKLPTVLAPGGKVAIMSFHSGEDRMVKKSFQRYLSQGIYKEISPNFIRPSAEECNTNSRAKSAKLRWAIKGD